MLKPQQISRERQQAHEKKIREAFLLTFDNAHGENVLNWMKNETINRVLPRGTSGDEALHHVGACNIVLRILKILAEEK